MLFASCENGGDEPQVVKPNFPEVQAFTAEAGGSYELTFVAEKAWTVALPATSQSVAFLVYDGLSESSHSGEAGEYTVVVKIREGVISYAKDIVAEVALTMEGFTETIATYTVARTEFPVNVTGAPNAGSEASAKSTFTQGGHPEDGPFASAPHTYTLRHYRGNDAKYADFYVQHDLDASTYNYAVYVRDANGEFAVVDGTSSWVEFISFGNNDEKFRLYMDYTKAKKVKNVGYEAYVNLEDENGDALVSVYHVYNPDEEVVVKTSMGLADAALAAEKGVTLVGGAYSYTLTLPSADILTTEYLAAALKFKGYNEVYGGFGSGTQLLKFEHDVERDVYYVCLDPEATLDGLTRTEVLNISAVGDAMHSYTINLVFDWIAASDENVTGDSVNFVNAEVANAAGATLVKLESSDADYNNEWGIDVQYRLTYTSADLFATPAKAALNVPGFELGLIVNVDDMSADHFNYSEALQFYKDSTTGEVLLARSNSEDGGNAVPNGSCELFCCDATGKKFIRILFVLNAQ